MIYYEAMILQFTQKACNLLSKHGMQEFQSLIDIFTGLKRKKIHMLLSFYFAVVDLPIKVAQKLGPCHE